MQALMRLKNVLSVTGLKRSSLYAQVAVGKFPRPIKIGPRSAAWIESEIDAWIGEQIKQTRAAGKEKQGERPT